VECIETITEQNTGEQRCTRFVHVTDILIDETWARLISQTGRLLWKIENEGFNTQKNHGYGLQHNLDSVAWKGHGTNLPGNYSIAVTDRIRYERAKSTKI
jgi:hypothetical protein